MFLQIISFFQNFDDTRTPEVLEIKLLYIQMWPLAQYSLYFWTFILQTFKLCLYTQILLCFSGASGKAEIIRW